MQVNYTKKIMKTRDVHFSTDTMQVNYTSSHEEESSISDKS